VAQQGFADQRNVVQQVLAVVDHQQHLPRMQQAGNAEQRLVTRRA